MIGIAVGIDVAQFLHELDDSREDDAEGDGVTWVGKLVHDMMWTSLRQALSLWRNCSLASL